MPAPSPTHARGLRPFAAAALLLAAALISLAAVPTTSRAATATTRPNPAPAVAYLQFDGAGPAKVSASVRRAVALAINRPELARLIPAAQHPRAWSSLVPGGIAGSGKVGAATAAFLPPSGAPQVAAATQLLASAGWKPGAELQLLTTSDALSMTAAGRVKSDLGAVGITVVVHPVSEATFTKTIAAPARAKAYDLWIYGWVADEPTLRNFLQIGTCRMSFGICDAFYDKVYRALLKSPSTAGRLKLATLLETRITGPKGSFPVVPFSSQTIATS